MSSPSILPIHFFTIVLNGEPFIRYHVDVLRHLPFDWHWHVVEGVADLRHDTAWAVANGGQIDDRQHHNGLSNDGTSSYLDELAALFPHNITLYRPEPGAFWDGKLAMVNAPLETIRQECLLWQVDVDEFWTAEQICTSRQLFLDHPDKTAAFYWCRFFVGKGLLVSSRNCYSQNPAFEWLRTWRYTHGCRWQAHEPPQLHFPNPDGTTIDLASLNPFTHAETEEKGLVFQHFAYLLPQQLRFKESYYGYSQALYHWIRLQKEREFPLRLGDFLPWVPDETSADTAEQMGVIPLPVPRAYQRKNSGTIPDFRIILDGVFFQNRITGIARVWQAIMEEWAGMYFGRHLVVLDRGRTAPRLPGLHYRDLPLHDYARLEDDRSLLQRICDEEGAGLFLSTYYSTPLTTPSVLMIHDMIPEVMQVDLSEPPWREKLHAIAYAASYCAVSGHTARDLIRFYPDAAHKDIHVVHNGVSAAFYPAPEAELDSFKVRYGITKPYYLFVGPVEWYKNFDRALEAFSRLPGRERFLLVRTRAGEGHEEHPLLADLQAVVTTGRLDDQELRAAYSGALALVYPSLYEGFGLPVLEAMACGCPVICGRISSLPEVAGDAACCIDTTSVDALRMALLAMQMPEERERFRQAGFTRAARFSWGRTAGEIIRVVVGEIGLQQGLDDLLLSQPLRGKP